MKNYTEFYKETVKAMGEYGKGSPKAMGAFMKLHHEGSSNGALDSKYKELIALGISIHIKCEGCIVYHLHDALKAGATREEIIETINTTVALGGGPAVIYGSKAFAALNEFDDKNFVK